MLWRRHWVVQLIFDNLAIKMLLILIIKNNNKIKTIKTWTYQLISFRGKQSPVEKNESQYYSDFKEEKSHNG